MKVIFFGFVFSLFVLEGIGKREPGGGRVAGKWEERKRLGN